MKYDLYPIIIRELKKKYSFGDNYSVLKLYKYINIRCSVEMSKRKFNDIDLIRFILSELNITEFNGDSSGVSFSHVKYKDNIYLNYEWSSEFIENFRFRASMEGSLDYKGLQEEVFIKGYRKARKFKDVEMYKEYIEYYRLYTLNDIFSARPEGSLGVDGFETNLNHNPFKRTLEEKLEAMLDSSKLFNSSTTAYITEQDLEDYLYSNINKIEQGLSVIGRQIEIDGGIIDILAVDVNDNLCVIELKINEDKSIVWQALHYPKEISKKYRDREVRMMTVAPSYSQYVSRVLEGIDDVEIYEYNIDVSKGVIEDLNIKRNM